jgi:hypothetical protein
VAPRGGSPGPRQAPGPRSGSGRRAPGAAGRAPGPGRRSGHPRGAATAADDRVAERATAAQDEQEPGAADASLAARGELSGWRLMLDQLDELLRDPTLTRALAAFARRLGPGVRGLGAAARRLAGALARLRFPFPRRLLLALLALLALAVPLALLALLTSAGDRRASDQPARRAAAAGGTGLPGAVGMPNLLTRSARVRPVKVALVLDHTYGAAPLRRELRALGTWLSEHHAPGTRVTVIDAGTARASGRLRDADLARARTTRRQPSTAAAIRSALGRQAGRRLLVALGSAAPSSTASTLQIATRRGASTGSSAALRRGGRSRVTIDDRRPDALAASVARAIMAVSGQRERR